MRDRLSKAVLIWAATLTVLTIQHVNGNDVRSNIHGRACHGQIMEVQCPEPFTLEIGSITIFSNPNVGEITDVCKDALNNAPCQRPIRGENDVGLSGQYKYFFDTIRGLCVGRNSCMIPMPEKEKLVGEATETNTYTSTKDHTCDGRDTTVKQFVGVLGHFTCVSGFVPTITTPNGTTTTPAPTAPPTTTPYAVFVNFYNPVLRDREKIVLGVAIGLAIVILIVLLLILYCWETVRNQKKFRKLLQMLGRPTEDADAYDEFQDYARAEAWKDETDNAEALGEYTGVKPDEFMTIDRKHMESSGMIISDNCGTMTLGKGNSCSTLTRNGGGGSRNLPTVTIDAPAGPVNYDTTENLELEERMAANMAGGPTVEDGDEMTSKH